MKAIERRRTTGHLVMKPYQLRDHQEQREHWKICHTIQIGKTAQATLRDMKSM